MTRGEFIIPTTCGFATRGRNYTIPTPPPEGIEAIPQIDKPHLTNAQKVGGRLEENPQIFLKFNLDCRFNVVRQKKTNE